MKISPERLKYLQSLPLETKIELSKCSINEWYEYWNGNVRVSFSGGKDSTVLLDLVRSEFPEVVGTFVDTGLEYPEIKKFVKTIDNIEIIKPKMNFKDVIDKYGYPCVSKSVSRKVSDLQNASEKNKNVRNLRLTGFNKNGNYIPSFKLPKKWMMLIESEFRFSDRCCDKLKKEPIKRYEKMTGKYGFVGTLVGDSQQRRRSYLATGCNIFNGTSKKSIPISFWTEKDIWEYIKTRNIPYSTIYDMGEHNTGCMFCMFGVHMEKEPNRFQRMKISHPKHYDYCINKLGLGKVLDFIGVKY